MRQLVCEELDFLGIQLDKTKNEIKSKGIRTIQNEDSKVKILVVPTNEELEIAKQAMSLFEN
jgi:acetate kinase